MANLCDEAATRAWEAFTAGRHDEATAICSEMLAHSPDHAGLLGVYGVIVGERGDIEAALQKLLRARSIAPDNPDWSFNLGIAYLRGGRLYEAKTALLEALRLRPRNIGYLIELAILHASLDEDRDTLAICLDVIAQEPDDADGHLLLAETLLRRGEMLLGWRAYIKGHRKRRDRSRIDAPPAADLTTTLPRWNGKPSPDTSILLDCDQGFGETIQFARYLPLVARQCKSVVLQTPIELIPLLSRIPDITVIPLGQQPQPAHTERTEMSELPGLFATTVENIPGGISYLDADPARVHAWRERLTAFTGENRVRVGLTWSGQVKNQRQALSSLTFAQLTPLLAVPGVAFISLQKPVPTRDVGPMRCTQVLDLSAELTDFGETAAVLANLDLVISTDSCVAHLAGALGQKVWVLLPRPADWRWFRDRDDSPWYPTMQLFRQETNGDWGDPITRAAAALVAFAGKTEAVPTVPYEQPPQGKN